MALGGSCSGNSSMNGSISGRVFERNKSLATKGIAIDGSQTEKDIRDSVSKTR